jgi:hypothetical protein
VVVLQAVSLTDGHQNTPKYHKKWKTTSRVILSKGELIVRVQSGSGDAGGGVGGVHWRWWRIGRWQRRM